MSGDSTVSAFLQLFKSLVEDVRTEAYYSQTTNYVAFMGYTILLWDHIISFGDEVQYIWMRPKSPATYLFFVNRYFTPIAFIGNLVAYFSGWSPETYDKIRCDQRYFTDGRVCRCHRFVRYEGSCTTIALEVAAIMLFLRVWALYRNQNLILGSVIILFLLETGVLAWLMTDSVAVEHHYTVKACTMIFDPKKLGRFWPSLSAWLPLLYDTYVTFLTLYQCLPRVRTSSTAFIFRVLMRDGLLYYSVIFMINLILAIMIVAAPDPVKNITAQLEQMLTVAMISRITLSLRRSAAEHALGRGNSHDNVHQFDLDAWQVAKRDYPPDMPTVHSSTVCAHINVVPRSDVLSDSQDIIVSVREDDGKYEESPVALGTESIGVLSISPAHTHEAAMAAGLVDPWVMMDDRNAYELRVMRPAHFPRSSDSNHLHLPER